jgi:Protein of unknown function (DUF1501)
MLTIYGRGSRGCDGVSRRGFLKIGGLGVGAGALTLTDVFRAEARAGTTGSQHKAVIHVFLGGGPPHQDMWEIKTEAPAEIRGEFKPINTKVPGIQIGEVFTKLAARMDKCVAIRSIVGARGGHDAVQCNSGWDASSMRNMGGRPSLGAAVSKLRGPVDPSVPPFVGLAKPTQHRPWSDSGIPGFLGTSYAPFRPDGQGMSDLTLNMPLERLGDRRKLMSSFDSLRRELDTSGQVGSMDALTERALGVLTSSKLLEALDVSREPEKIRAMYGDGKPYKYQYDGAPTCNDHLLIARRLIEAGVRVVTLSFGRWDSHGKNFDLVRDHGGKLDQCLSALIDDLEVRGMLNDVSIVVWGEFGRTPRINKGAGRDHWPQVSCAFLAGGGMRTGQTIGSTNRLGEYASNRPVTFQEVHATLYHNLGLNPATTTITDPTGRPQHVIEAAPLRELVG